MSRNLQKFVFLQKKFVIYTQMKQQENLFQLLTSQCEALELSQEAASHKISGNASFFQNLRRGAKPSYARIEKAARILGLEIYLGPPRDLPVIGEETPHYGKIAAGGGTMMEDAILTPIADPDQNHLAPAPPGGNLAGMFAVTITGNSMTPSYRDGDLIFLWQNDPAAFDPDRLTGVDCAVTLEGGEVFLKRLRRPDSGKEGEWNLESLNPRWPVMSNQRLLSALPVRYVKRKI